MSAALREQLNRIQMGLRIMKAVKQMHKVAKQAKGARHPGEWHEAQHNIAWGVRLVASLGNRPSGPRIKGLVYR